MRLHIGRKAPKGYRELPGGMHLGRGIWLLKIEPVPVHSDHPLRHWDRTCPACLDETIGRGAASTSGQRKEKA